MMTYPESVEFLYALGNEMRTAKLGLERIGRLLAALGHPDRAFRAVHVAGTNGKGSTCAMIESALRLAGHPTGLYTSPHLVQPTERIRVGGEAVSREAFAEAFERVHRAVEDWETHPSYFETVTAMAFLLFREAGVERAVIEVGLGGRLDATNVIQPELCVITPVDLDHEAWLGSSIEAIAEEKAGILKPGVEAVVAEQRPEARERILTIAAEVGSPVVETREREVGELELHAQGCRFQAAGGGRVLEVECRLPGEHQVTNALTAAVALDHLGVSRECIKRGIREAVWPGRMERVASSPDIILDGAHNPAGVRALAAYIRRFYRDRTVWLIYGTMRDKSVGEIGDLLWPLASRLIVTAPDSPRALRPAALLEMVAHPRAQVAARLADALELAREQAAPGDVIFVTGSLFLVGEARALLVE